MTDVEWVDQRTANNRTLHCLEGDLASRRLHNSSTPISTPPPEIFAEIFIVYQLACRGTTGYGWNSLRQEWYILSQVCHSWREIMHDTAALWTQIEWPGHPVRSDLYQIACYIKRAKQMSVDIVISTIPSGVLHHAIRFLSAHKN